ncbi:hypothetical protein [Thermococcus sp. Bubb.Bath]|uniref:hypothetical protein n=1 Tax=Thermococcus sp. Bubb.Bath TaxID=1638242 RepID=UPI00143B8439|nr:hypothetical protein [Thermococcus sp. Bubb.Bath]NJF25504.1 Ig-like domain repeat protein [Thermococcus sp. Bubb.Bath]
MALNKPENPKFMPTPSLPKLVITNIQVQPITCGGKTTVSVTLNNYGGITGVGTLKIYVDGNLAVTVGTEVDPYTPVTETVKLSVQSGTHTFKAEVENPTGSSSKTLTTTLHSDWDCDGLLDEQENSYGTNPYNKDTDGDGIIDSQDMNPLGNYTVTVYILRARALEDVDSATVGHNAADMSLKVTVNGQTKTLFLTDNKDDSDKNNKPLVSGSNLIDYLNKYAIAKATFDVPDDKETVPITFNLYDRDDDGKIDEMDVSPGPGYEANIYYNLKTGTWSGDDYPGDEWEYYGYGHLSGCGDGSCGIGPRNPDKDVKVYSKYQSILEKNGIKGEILSVHSSTKASEVRWGSRRNQILIENPRKVMVVQILLPNGTVKNVTLVNTYGARTIKLSPIKLPAKPDVAEGGLMPVNVSAEALTEAGQVKLSKTVVTYSSSDYPDGEIWFVIVPNDPDLIPFWREVELNKELKEKGISWRFDPSDKLWDDESMDYDGDGVPNAVEQLIGKDPAKKDILGISLKVSTEWPLSDEDKKNLLYGIRKASDFVYDYTDGYAMITSVQIWDDKRHWKDADVRVNSSSANFYDWGSDNWPQTTTVGGYWIRRDAGIPDKFKAKVSIEMPREFASPLRNMDHLGEYIQECILSCPIYQLEACVLSKFATDKVKIGSADYGRAIAHELGHYVFILGDEYIDWKGRKYYVYDLFDIHDMSNPLEMIFKSDAWWFYTNNVPPHSIMNNAHRYSEVSWVTDYERFESMLKKRFREGWMDHLTDQWGDPYNYKEYSNSVRHEAAWNTLYKVLTLWEGIIWVEDPDRKGIAVGFNKKISNNIEIKIKDVDSYIPKTGPYTGVGYFMEVIWG